jgi:hypothetical protein
MKLRKARKRERERERDGKWIMVDDCYGTSLKYKCVSMWRRRLTKLIL